MPFRFSTQSLSRKFMLAGLATTLTALFVTCAGMLALEIYDYQTTWVSDLRAQGDIVAKVTTPALEFNDPKTATENLAQLRVRPKIFAAAIMRADGSILAQYSRDADSPFLLPAMPQADDAIVTMERVQVFRKVFQGSDFLGTVYVCADYPLGRQINRYLLILAGAMLLGAIIALAMSSWLQAAVARPILALTEAANRVIRERNFSMRVEKSTDDEVGILVDAFNSMLIEVGDRARALEQLNNTLEVRVAERTAELEKAHEQLRQAQKLEAVGQLTGGVAHDFNNVLQIISGNLQLLQPAIAGNPEARKRLESAALATDRGAKLSAHLLAFARRQPLQPVAINVGRILRNMDDLLRRALGGSIHIETVVAGGLWTTLVDPHQLENAILNLAINARDAMNGEGRLTLELGNAMLDDDYVAHEPGVDAGQYVMLAITDTGCGMAPEIVSRVFEPFFTTKREGEGTGLGLSMVYGFVKQSGGHIRVYSEVGSGTTIKIYLPRSMQDEVEITTHQHVDISGGSETILVVEDDLTVQATVVDMLSGLGYRVIKANDGQSALSILQSGLPVDLLFTDVVMPGPVRSVDLARQAKQILPEIRVLYTSGYTQNAIVHGGRLDPGVELLSKPYRREDLARKVRQLFAAKEAPRATESTATPQNTPEPPDDEPQQARKILIVEDNDDARTTLSHLLTALGHTVYEASSAEDAIAALEKHPVDTLLTDYSLPGMSGLELARQVAQQSNRRTRIIIASGYSSAAHQIDFEAKWLTKPFLLEALEEALG